jgi:hypothetical protein
LHALRQPDQAMMKNCRSVVILVANPPLTTADGDETILEMPFEFIDFGLVPQGASRASILSPREM